VFSVDGLRIQLGERCLLFPIPYRPHKSIESSGSRRTMRVWEVRDAAAMFYRQTEASLLDSYYIVVQSVQGVKR
jgi:hypothetical protein